MLWAESRPYLNALDPGPHIPALLLSNRAITPALTTAFDMAYLDMIAVQDMAACLSTLCARKPDLVIFDPASLPCPVSTFLDSLEQARNTATLPAIALSDDPSDIAQCSALSADFTVAEAFLTIRALLRRDRPGTLHGQRQSGSFMLDESNFQLHHGGARAMLSKSDICVLGPFFDAPRMTFDRAFLAGLVFEPKYAAAAERNIDVYVSKVRRSIRRQLGRESIQPVRGVGYRFSDTP